MPGPIASFALSQGVPMAMGLASQYFGKDDRKRAQQQAEEQQAQQRMVGSFSPRALIWLNSLLSISLLVLQGF